MPGFKRRNADGRLS